MLLFVVVVLATWPAAVPLACLRDASWLSACATGMQAVLTVVAVTIAIAVPAWQTHQAQYLQKIASRPRLGFSWAISGQPPHIELGVRNSGLGPAIILAYRVFVDEEEIIGQQKDLWTTAFAGLMLPPGQWSGSVPDTTMAMAPSSSLTLLEYHVADQRDVNKDALETQAERIAIEMKYESFFGEQWTVDSVSPHP